MAIKIRLGPKLYDQIRTLVHDELNEQRNEQKNRQKFEQLAMKIRGQLDEMSGPKRSRSGPKGDLGTRNE